jgi:hypothetical protein
MLLLLIIPLLAAAATVNNIKEVEEKLGFPILHLSAFPLVLSVLFS